MKSMFAHLGEPLEEDVADSDALSKFFEATPLANFVGRERAEAFRKETSSIDRRAAEIYRKIAATDATSTSLAKNSPTSATQKVWRTEVTKYSSGLEVIAELDENNVCIRTYSRNGAA